MRLERLRVEAYRPEHRGRWNALVRASKNGTFLFHRDFMEYHRDRFEDLSLVAIEGEDNIVALLPAARERRQDGDWLSTHPGLTYGGWVSDQRMTTPIMLQLFDLLRAWASAERIMGLRYKAMPSCYHRLPAEEDLYALFVQGAALVRQDVSSVIELGGAPAWSKGKRQPLAKARAAGVSVTESRDLEAFMEMLGEVLSAHGVAPVHTAEELAQLMAAFPDEIRLYAAGLDGRAVAFVLLFDAGQTVHTQYMASGPDGRAVGGLEAIVDHIQHTAYAGRRFLSFGVSTEDGGRVLNHGLVSLKEMFGARAVVAPTYELTFTPPA